MNNNLIALLFIAVIFGACSRGAQKEKHETIKKPNIVYILADDLGYGDLSVNNPESKIKTPNLDKLANEGVRFTDAHSNSAVCTPTRYGILTGRYAFRSSLKSGVLWGYSPSLIEPSRSTVATFLKDNGYQTACIGKWHLGLDWAKKDDGKVIRDVSWDQEVPLDFDDNVDYTKPVKGGPSDHGFDYSLIIPASLDMSPYLYVHNGMAVEDPSAYTEGKDQATSGRGVFWRKGKIAPAFDFQGVLPTFINDAQKYISDHASDEKPFFLYLPLPAPHTPWLPSEQYHQASRAGTYGDFVAMVDDMIGKVIKSLEEKGLMDNTLIIVTSDNGADWRPEDIEATSHRSNYMYKGRKADIYEAGHRVPFIAKWKGKIPAGTSSDQLMCTTDLTATLAGMLGTNVPSGAAEDSYNLWPAYIAQAPDTSIREFIIHHSLDGFFAIREGKWKYAPQLGSGGFSQPKTIVAGPGEAPGTLYDMSNDVREERNLYMEHPEVVKELSEKLKAFELAGSKQ